MADTATETERLEKSVPNIVQGQRQGQGQGQLEVKTAQRKQAEGVKHSNELQQQGQAPGLKQNQQTQIQKQKQKQPILYKRKKEDRPKMESLPSSVSVSSVSSSPSIHVSPSPSKRVRQKPAYTYSCSGSSAATATATASTVSTATTCRTGSGCFTCRFRYCILLVFAAFTATRQPQLLRPQLGSFATFIHHGIDNHRYSHLLHVHQHPHHPPEPVVQNTLPFNHTTRGEVGACLLIKDDNHWLIEWLAFHYHVLPLRHLVLVADPNSRTSPQAILQRWKYSHLMNIQQWQDPDFLPRIPKNMWKQYANNTQLLFHRHRQGSFYEACLQHFYREKNIRYVILTDTDEFTSLNPHNPVTQQFPVQQPGSVLRFLLNQQHQARQSNHNNPKFRIQRCLNLQRYMVGANESDATLVDQYLNRSYHRNDTNNDTNTANATNTALQGNQFLTQRFLYRGELPVPLGKNLVNLQAIRTQPLVKYRIQKGSATKTKKKRTTKNRSTAGTNTTSTTANVTNSNPTNTSTANANKMRRFYVPKANRKKNKYTTIKAKTKTIKNKHGLVFTKTPILADPKLAILRNPHRVSMHCPTQQQVPNMTSTQWFQVRHYIGTPEQYFFRQDPRSKAGDLVTDTSTIAQNHTTITNMGNDSGVGSDSDGNDIYATTNNTTVAAGSETNASFLMKRGQYPQRNMEHYQRLSDRGSQQLDSSIQGWIEGFIQDVGLEMAEYLLQEIGQVGVEEN